MGVDSEKTVMVRVCKDELMGNQRVGGETWGIVRICVITVGLCKGVCVRSEARTIVTLCRGKLRGYLRL